MSGKYVLTKEKVCCNQSTFLNHGHFSDGLYQHGQNGRCIICGKDWEIEQSTISMLTDVLPTKKTRKNKE